MGICGNGASYDILVEAGVENCDIFISVTEMDEINIIASILRRKLGRNTLLRVCVILSIHNNYNSFVKV